MSVVNLSDETYGQFLSAGRVLVLFGAPWSGSGTMMRSVVEELAGDFPDWHFGFVDFDDNQECALLAGVSAVPTIISFRQGVVQWKRTGAVPLATLRNLLSAE